MQWTVHGERRIYSSAWVNLALVDVEVPGGDRFEHHVIRAPAEAAGVVVHDHTRGVLLLWRHRFITDSWGWEIPAGRVDPGEDVETAAAREVLEETGWRVGSLSPLVSFNPMNGVSDQRFNVFSADGAEQVGEPEDPSESDRVEWVPVGDLRQLITTGLVQDGMTLAGLLVFLLRL